MDRMISGGSGRKPARRFAFSWADEVEREEQQLQQQQNEQSPRREEKRERTKTDPFGAARPREVVLAEKGVDWRDRDRELEVAHRSANCRTRVQGKRDASAAPAPAPMTTTRRQHAASTPTAHPKIDAPPVTCISAWGGERKCAGKAPARGQVQSLVDQGRRVLGELNTGPCRNASRWSSSKSAGAEEIEAGKIAAADSENRGRSSVLVMAGMGSDESGVDRKRTRRKRKGRKMASKRTKKQQSAPLGIPTVLISDH